MLGARAPSRALVFEDDLDVHLLTHHVVQTDDLTLSRLQHGLEAARRRCESGKVDIGMARVERKECVERAAVVDVNRGR